MQKNDIKLIVWVVLICGLLYAIFSLYSGSKASIAEVFYDGKMIKTIDMNINDTYTVKGYNGNVDIEVNSGKIRVTKETSPHHICANQGYISKTSEVLVCLPNKIVIKIYGDDKAIDAVVE